MRACISTNVLSRFDTPLLMVSAVVFIWPIRSDAFRRSLYESPNKDRSASDLEEMESRVCFSISLISNILRLSNNNDADDDDEDDDEGDKGGMETPTPAPADMVVVVAMGKDEKGISLSPGRAGEGESWEGGREGPFQNPNDPNPNVLVTLTLMSSEPYSSVHEKVAIELDGR